MSAKQSSTGDAHILNIIPVLLDLPAPGHFMQKVLLVFII